MKIKDSSFSEYLKVKHFWTKLISLVMATALWFYVQDKNSSALIIYATIDKPKTPSKFVILNSFEKKRVKIKLYGVPSALNFNKDNWKVEYKYLSKPKEGLNRYELQSNQVAPEGVNVEIDPAYIDIRLAFSLTKRLIIKPNFPESIRNKFAVNSVKLVPRKVDIKGPQKLVKNLKYINTLPIDAEHIQGDFENNQGKFEFIIKLDDMGKKIQFIGANSSRTRITGNLIDKSNFNLVEISNIKIEDRGLSKKLKIKIFPNTVSIKLLVPHDYKYNKNQLGATINSSKYYLQNGKIMPYDVESDIPIELKYPPEFDVDKVQELEKKPEKVRIVLRISDD